MLLSIHQSSPLRVLSFGLVITLTLFIGRGYLLYGLDIMWEFIVQYLRYCQSRPIVRSPRSIRKVYLYRTFRRNSDNLSQCCSLLSYNGIEVLMEYSDCITETSKIALILALITSTMLALG